MSGFWPVIKALYAIKKAMELKQYILLPWAIIIPYFVYWLIRRNYLINTGKCPKCKKEIINITQGHIDITKFECNNCKEKEQKQSSIRSFIIFVFLIWSLISIGIMRSSFFE